jgi:hypothetical protein
MKRSPALAGDYIVGQMNETESEDNRRFNSAYMIAPLQGRVQ